MELWHTILELKENYVPLGFKGDMFFISEMPWNIETDRLDYVIAKPTIMGGSVGKTWVTWVVNEVRVEELFNVSEKTFAEVEDEMVKEFRGKKDS